MKHINPINLSLNQFPAFSVQDFPWNEFVTAAKEYFGFNFSLLYPEKAKLPLEEFCAFYFKSEDLNNLTKQQRINRAYNDALSAGIHLYTAPRPEGFSSINEFIEYKYPLIKEYSDKILFAKFYAETYMRSQKSASELLSRPPAYKLHVYRLQKKYPQLAAFIKEHVTYRKEN